MAMNPWQPMTKPIDLKHMGKLVEELGELVQVCSRCMIQGIDERDPTRTETNKEWLEKEIADVYANLFLVREHFKLKMLVNRMEIKKANLREWHAMLEENKK